VYLAGIASLPNIVFKYMPEVNFTFAGTSLLIVVSVVLETLKQINAQLVMHEYE
jgi:preprotein translocase subunit SecY